MFRSATCVRRASSRLPGTGTRDNVPKYWCELNFTFSSGVSRFVEPMPLMLATQSVFALRDA
jgi:hypothetical protein